MPTWLWIVIAVAAAIVLLDVLWGAFRARRSRSLKERFGPEYDRVAADAPSSTSVRSTRARRVATARNGRRCRRDSSTTPPARWGTPTR